MAKTKIIATLGPASSNYTTIRKMVVAGMDVARLNFSHGTYRDQLHRLKLVRQINTKYRRRIRIMQDLEGYRIRIGHFKNRKHKILKAHMTVRLTKDPDDGNVRTIPFDYKGDLKNIKKGQLIYIDDGNMTLKTRFVSKRSIHADVIEGGVLEERKGVNMPGARIPFTGGLTEKDKFDLKFGLKHRVDYIAQSFVRTKKDIDIIKEFVKPKLQKCMIIAKIEAQEAIRNMDEIIDAADGVMIARGDMGVAVPIYEIAVIQKQIIRRCNKKKKVVITATEMLEHMTEHSRPTRAEVTDVANAILDGTDFVMLSAESASGKYPVKAVQMMNQIIEFTERHIRNLRK